MGSESVINGLAQDLADLEENRETVQQEREACEPEYPCPPELWIGPFAEVAEIVGIKDWRVWIAVCAALAARASRNIHVSYHGPLHGMGYFLLVARSGTGKGLCSNIFKKLLPPGYRFFKSVESGQALAHILADIERDEKGRILQAVASPSCLRMNEWSMLLNNMDIHGSSLMQRLNDLYDADDHFDLMRSDKKGMGNINIENPTFTLLGLTTISEFQKCVKPSHINSGFINRHLILPAPRLSWKYNASNEFVDYSAIEHYAASLPLSSTLGNQQPMKDLYEPDAYALDDAWASCFFEAIHNADNPDQETIYRRLHVYNRRIQLLYAWGMKQRRITTTHVLAAKAVVETSYRFLGELFGSMPLDLPPTIQVKASLEDEILALVLQEPGIRKDTTCQRLKRRGGYTLVSTCIERLIQAGALQLKLKGKGKCLYPQEPSSSH